MIRKRITAFVLVCTLIITLLAGKDIAFAANVTLTSSQIANHFNAKVGQSVDEAMCLAFVANSFAELGATRSSACCAYNYGSSHIVSTSMDNIPIGADVFLNWNSNYSYTWYTCPTCKQYCHHVAVYVGDGYIIHTKGTSSGETVVSKDKLSDVLNYWNMDFRGWGYHGNVTISNTVVPTGVSLSKTSLSFTAKGATSTLTATVSPSNATDKSVTWKSSNTSVATVDSNGKVTAVGNGTATITVTTKSGAKTATCKVTVTIPTQSSDGWYYTTVLPSNITSTNYEIQYQNVYEKYASSSPGTGWKDTGVDKIEYTKSGAAYESDWPLQTSNTVRLVEYYYYHYCGPNTAWNDVNYYARDGYIHRDEMHMDSFTVYEYTSGMDSEGNIPWYHLKWNDASGYDAYCHRYSTGGTCDGSGGEHGERSPYWYKKYVYQNYTAKTLNQYQKTSEWGTKKDSSATTVNIRYRLKPTSVSLNKTTATLTSKGATVSLTATVAPSNAGCKDVTWKSSNTSVATVDSNGKVTAVGNGTATITVATVSGGKTATCKVTVSIATTGVTLNKTSATLTSKGQTLSLTATVSPSNAANKNVTWKSSNTSVATVDSNGKVTAVGNGTATITVTTASGGKTATCKVTVNIEVATTGVTLNQTSATLTSKGQTLTLTATVSPSNATNKNVTWKSSNTSVATVDSNGKVTAVGNGTAMITVTTASGSKTATCKVTVSIPVAVTGVTLNQTSATLTSKGQTLTLTATVTPSNATNKNVTWKSSNTSVATVDSNGKVTAVGNGTATITVTTASGNKTATCKVTVSIPVAVTGVTLNQTSATLTSKGQTLSLTATVTPSNATNKNVTWKSSNTAVATVDSNGKVTAVGNGTATITVTTASGNKTATCKVTVSIPVAVTGVTLNQTSASLTSKGQTLTLTATVSPSNATNKNVTWKSSNTAVATVDSNGKVTAVGNGTATITVTTVSGGKTATCKVIVNVKEIPTKITSSIVNVNESLGCISKITIGTTIQVFRSKLNEKDYVKVYSNNQQVADTAVLATGMNACIMDGNTVVKKYSVIVTGDTNGDGKINITDMIAVKANILKKTLLNGVYKDAADVNGDGKINVTDFIKIKATLLKKDTIEGVAVK